jgi:hypothetical protein
MKCIVKVEHGDGGIGQGIILEPASAQDETAFESLRVGTQYKCDLRKARNPDHHRKGFALIKLILDSQEKYTNIEDLLTELKLKVGWYREHVRSNGELVYIPKSISFADMDQTEFEEFYERVMDIALQEYGLEEAVEFLE